MIRIICPQDPTIRCVERQAKKLFRRLDGVAKVYIVRPNIESKLDCHRMIREWSNDDVIVFMGHGRSDALLGSKGRFFDMTGDRNDLMFESGDFYNDESFIDSSCYGLMAEKSLICFSCESDLLAKKLTEAGAKAVVGFGKMPTSRTELEQDAIIKTGISKRMIACINGAINVAFRDSVVRAFKMRGKLEDVSILFKMEIRRQVSFLLHSKVRYKYDVANVLYDIAKTVKVVGDKRVKLR